MGFQDKAFADYKYRKWIHRTDNLDYFDFAKYCKLNERGTNSHYASILNVLDKSANLATRNAVKKASKLFKERKGKSKSNGTSEFYERYNKFWNHDTKKDEGDDFEERVSSDKEILNDDVALANRLRKRRHETLESLNDSFMKQLESDAKKVI
ncbi:hypothetical protein BDC45DRAFT_69697 [Circinella umbellata]|nr:hypothetical protein BDC45DRAFT_69697 [Circinella umbellata]